MTFPSPIDRLSEEVHQPGARGVEAVVVFTFWLTAVLFVGFVEWSIFALSAIDGNGCAGGEFVLFASRTGGAASGGALLAAVVIGLSLWLAAGIVAYRQRGRLGSVMFGFAAVYGVSLFALWPIASLIWGSRHCS